MKSFLLSTAAVFALSSAVNAADLDIAPAPEPMPMYDWSGFYIGGAAGWIGAKSKSRLGVEVDGYDDFFGLSNGWGRTNKPDGGLFGVYGGYNWHMPDSGIVLGIDGDFYGANAKDSKRYTYRDQDFFGEDLELSIRGKEKIKSTWAIRGRLGWAIENFMPYIAGGFAGASMKSSVSGEIYDAVHDEIPSYYSDKRSKTKSYTGWTMGAGAEWMITPNWLLRADYQYKDLGKKNNLSRDSNFNGNGLDIDYKWRNRTKLKSNQFTVGGAFKF
jgi:outer membrane immunogenic protein